MLVDISGGTVISLRDAERPEIIEVACRAGLRGSTDHDVTIDTNQTLLTIKAAGSLGLVKRLKRLSSDHKITTFCDLDEVQAVDFSAALNTRLLQHQCQFSSGTA